MSDFIPTEYALDPSPWVGRYGIRVSIWTPPSSGVETLVSGDSSRVYLAFQRTATGIIQLNPAPFSVANPGAFVLGDLQLLEFHWAMHRTLVTTNWYASGGTASSIVITEVYSIPQSCPTYIQGS